MTSNYLELIKYLTIQFCTAYTMQAGSSFTIENFCEIDPILLQVHTGQISYEKAKKKEIVRPGQVLLIPGGEPIVITYGAAPKANISQNQFLLNQGKYLQPISPSLGIDAATSFSCIHFRIQALQAFDLFSMLNFPPLLIRDPHTIDLTMQHIRLEQNKSDIAQERILTLYTELLVIELLRYINSQTWLVDRLLAKQSLLQEERLLKLLQYIQANLHNDLSNSQLATIAHISEDYMGLYFKALVGVSPQTYVEDQRLSLAMRLLRNTKQRIYKVSQQIGFRNTAYFCRRFKLKFGVQAQKIRTASFQV